MSGRAMSAAEKLRASFDAYVEMQNRLDRVYLEYRELKASEGAVATAARHADDARRVHLRLISEVTR